MLDQRDAEKVLWDLCRQGLLDAVAIPEVETEADQVAHQLLGCINYSALLAVYATAEDMRRQSGVPSEVCDTAMLIADQFLVDLVKAVVLIRAPLGPPCCSRKQ